MPSGTLQEGQSAWYIARAHRLHFLVDAADYYNAFFRAASLAKQSILILGWDLDSRLLLNREAEMSPQERKRCGALDPVADQSVTLLNFLNGLLEQTPDLKIHMLNWDYSVIYALEREAMAQIKLFWSAREGLEFQFDDRHPLGGSHHQKVVVIDDSIAFAGGIDLTGNRWDTPAHLPEGPGRMNPEGKQYGAFHDIQAMVSGEAARCLGELARERWRRCTDEILPPPTATELWPDGVPWTWQDISAGIVRTEPAYQERQEIRETETFLNRAIQSATDYIYIENQYLTSSSICDALCASLERQSGPEVVIVTPKECPGWLEEMTMGLLRQKVVKALRQSDLYGRLYLFYPTHGDADIFVHAKTLIIDHRLAFVSSANLSNRSMGMDTECGVALEWTEPDSQERAAIEPGIKNYLARLLAEHLGESAENIVNSGESPAAIIARLKGNTRTLKPLEIDEPILEDLLPENTVDPEKPANIQKAISDILPL